MVIERWRQLPLQCIDKHGYRRNGTPVADAAGQMEGSAYGDLGDETESDSRVTQVPREPLLLADFVLDDQYLHFPLR